jgi:hypothetical protein
MDCFLRAPVMQPAAMITAGHVMRQAAAVLDSDAFLGNTVAVAGLASAITSLVKRAVQSVEAACGMQQERQQLAAEPSQLAAACYPAAVWALVDDSSVLKAFSLGVSSAAMRITKPAIQNSSSSTSQAAASALLLAVVLVRSSCGWQMPWRQLGRSCCLTARGLSQCSPSRGRLEGKCIPWRQQQWWHPAAHLSRM